ncbi:receptor-type tyrosine-protein phosphatase alpha isoform X1 [Procambarus clarkii]|uniref:receptor-type tyrosine-protein phosphatase alpha isoform X1 n=1 Tax=Procambarus clarkii TaxID=6728 RepID=UPI0037437FA1
MLTVGSALLLFVLLSEDAVECGARVPGPPTNVNVTTNFHRQLDVSWSKPASSVMETFVKDWILSTSDTTEATIHASLPSVVDQYSVFWTNVNSSWANDNTTQLQYSIRNLADCTLYHVFVRAWENGVMGQPSATIPQTTLLNDAENLVMTQSGSDVTVSWTWEPPGTCGEPVVFNVSWNGSNSYAVVTETEYTITGVIVEEGFMVCVLTSCSNCTSQLTCVKDFQSPKNSDLPLILGLSIGIPVAVIIVCLAVFLYWKQYKKQPVYQVGAGNPNNRIGLDNMGFRGSPSTEEMLRNEFQTKFTQQEYKKPTTQALRHADRNRYADILPFDDTLVRVKHVEYINASYVLGKFIATQDPYPDQDDDFWQLIWDCNVHVIIRLSKDTSKHATARYVDDRGDNTWVMGHDELSVSLMDTLNDDSFCKRTLTVCKGEEVRVIHHFHMTDWPERSVPASQHALNLVMAARTANSLYSKNPVLIHCGAGCGRTGTIIAIWHLLDEFLEDRMANIVRTVEMMRECRMSMVQTEDQYVFIYKCFEDFKEKRSQYETHAATYEVVR